MVQLQSWASTLYTADAQLLNMTEGCRIVAAPKHRRRGMKAILNVLRTRHTLSAGAALGADRVSRTLWLVPFWSTPDRVAVGLLSLYTMLIIKACSSKHAMMLGAICLCESAETLPSTWDTGWRRRLSWDACTQRQCTKSRVY